MPERLLFPGMPVTTDLVSDASTMHDPARTLPEGAVGYVDANQHKMRVVHAAREPRFHIGREQLAHLRAIGHECGDAGQLQIPLVLLVLKREIHPRFPFDLGDLVAAIVGEEPQGSAERGEIALQSHRPHVELAGLGSLGDQHRRSKARQKRPGLGDRGVRGEVLVQLKAFVGSSLHDRERLQLSDRLQRNLSSHSIRRSVGQQFTMRSRGIPASRAWARAVSA